jgi:hypothetical protein
VSLQKNMGRRTRIWDEFGAGPAGSAGTTG